MHRLDRIASSNKRQRISGQKNRADSEDSTHEIVVLSKYEDHN